MKRVTNAHFSGSTDLRLSEVEIEISGSENRKILQVVQGSASRGSYQEVLVV